MLDHWLGIIEEQEFFTEYWEKKPLLVKRNEEGFFKDILSIKKLWNLLKSGAIAPRFIHMEGPGSYRSEAESFLNINNLGKDAIHTSQLLKIFNSFKRGHSLRFEEAEVYCPSLEDFSDLLKKKIPCRAIHSSLVMTPAGKQGYSGGSQGQDFFLLQVEGSKEWFVQGRSKEKFVLDPGSFLYLPGDFSFWESDLNNGSLHICFALTPFIWMDLLKESLFAFSEGHTGVRSALPPSQFCVDTANDMDDRAFEKAYQEKVLSVLESSSLEKGLARILMAMKRSVLNPKIGLK
jgi:hypothetical protein